MIFYTRSALHIPFYIVLLVLSACAMAQCGNLESSHVPAAQAQYDTLSASILLPFATYDSALSRANQLRAQWSKKLASSPASSQPDLFADAGQALHAFLIDSIFPYWQGTPWDFNGYTNIPGQGTVACGYFVSTPLKHIGFNLNRYKVAQQYSHSIVNTLCTDVKHISGHQKFLDVMQTQSNGLYIVGLDNHVGFVSKQNNMVHFIHSTYLQPSCVLSESAHLSEAMRYSKVFVLGNFCGNHAVIKKWLLNQSISIVP